ncbi:MAG: hypothetical protein ABJO02_14100 [Reichenbachiella sp.]|uniref:hypothetical protein n=1 Tax=Reichenbachiella sp. TaxID=2184521 RepID=UPI00329718D0
MIKYKNRPLLSAEKTIIAHIKLQLVVLANPSLFNQAYPTNIKSNTQKKRDSVLVYLPYMISKKIERKNKAYTDK